MVLNMLILNLPPEKIGAEMYELLTMANQTTEDVFSLLDNLLKWTKSQIGKLNVVYQDIDVVEVVDGVIDIFNMVAGLKKITIREEKPEKLGVFAICFYSGRSKPCSPTVSAAAFSGSGQVYSSTAAACV